MNNNKWQPIKTIPTDGTEVLTWTKGNGVQIAYCKYKTDRCFMFDFKPDNYSKYSPTYWQPLPKSPYKKKKQK